MLVLAFAGLSVVPLVAILAYGYLRNQAAITTSLDEQLARDTARSIHRVAELVDGVATAASIVGAAVEADPALFHTERGDPMIWRAVATAPQIDALYVSFEDGHHRVVSRIDDDRRRSDPRIPAAAVWHASYIDDYSTGAARARHRRFYAEWPTLLDGYTAIGDGVNVASRLEGVNKAFGSSVCVSDAVLAALGGRGVARPLRLVQVKGRRQAFMVYELLAIAGSDDRELAPRPHDEELVALGTTAANLRTAGDIDGALRAYQAVLARFPEDRVTRQLAAELTSGQAAD